MYEIIFTNEAKKSFSSLNKDQQERIASALERIKIRPYNFVRRLYKSKYFRLRVDNLRIILDINDMQLIIYVIEIGDRSNIYGKI
tara:strand:+ start:1189 stop:1443 length:255 start_codon:yes stop_codon:yes gene_type:complete